MKKIIYLLCALSLQGFSFAMDSDHLLPETFELNDYEPLDFDKFDTPFEDLNPDSGSAPFQFHPPVNFSTVAPVESFSPQTFSDKDSNWENYPALSVSEKKQYKCTFEGCGAVLKHAPSLKNHMEKHSGKVYKCEITGCEKFYTESSKLKLHMNNTHSGKTYNCTFPGCNEKFTRNDNLKRHIQRKHSPEGASSQDPDVQGNFECEVCGKTYTSLMQFISHKQKERADSLAISTPGAINAPAIGNPNFQDPHSPLVLNSDTLSELRLLDGPTASQDNKYVCHVPFCAKVYTHLNALTRHIQAKHEKKRYKCEFCGKTYLRNDDCRKHQKSCDKNTHIPEETKQ